MAARFINLSVGSDKGTARCKAVTLQQINGGFVPVGDAIGKKKHDMRLPRDAFRRPQDLRHQPFPTILREKIIGDVADVKALGDGLLQESNGFQRADEKMKKMFG